MKATSALVLITLIALVGLRAPAAYKLFSTSDSGTLSSETTQIWRYGQGDAGCQDMSAYGSSHCQVGPRTAALNNTVTRYSAQYTVDPTS